MPNFSYGLIFVKIQAKYGHFFGKNTGIIRALYVQAKIRAKFIFCDLSSVCDFLNVQSIIDLFAKQLNNALNLH